MDAMTPSLNGDREILPGRADWLAREEREPGFAGGKNDERQEPREARTTGGENDADGDGAILSTGRGPLAGLARAPGESPNAARRQAFAALASALPVAHLTKNPVDRWSRDAICVSRHSSKKTCRPPGSTRFHFSGGPQISTRVHFL